MAKETKQQYTPGPWHWQKGEKQDRLYAKNANHAVRVLVAEKQSGSRVVELNPADARLIRFAPDLFDVCKKLVEAITEPDQMFGGLVDQAEKLIAKAEGRAQ